MRPETRRPTPPPQRVDLRRIVLVGIAAWLVALVVAVVLLATGTQGWQWVAICGAGIALGGLGLLWDRRHR
ncbi:DUF2530 domain-containing protein [Xylanimonas protaetiae]|nr:DUF2530 domain-containing protein [Xylanimonas protaetiae]